MKKLASWLLMVSLIGLSITIVVLAGTGERAIPADIGCADCPPGATDGEAIIGPSVNLDPQVNSWPPPPCIYSGDTCVTEWSSTVCWINGGWTGVIECQHHVRMYYCPHLYPNPWYEKDFGPSCHCPC